MQTLKKQAEKLSGLDREIVSLFLREQVPLMGKKNLSDFQDAYSQALLTELETKRYGIQTTNFYSTVDKYRGDYFLEWQEFWNENQLLHELTETDDFKVPPSAYYTEELHETPPRYFTMFDQYDIEGNYPRPWIDRVVQAKIVNNNIGLRKIEKPESWRKNLRKLFN
jgi:hypothetical protein